MSLSQATAWPVHVAAPFAHGAVDGSTGQRRARTDASLAEHPSFTAWKHLVGRAIISVKRKVVAARANAPSCRAAVRGHSPMRPHVVPTCALSLETGLQRPPSSPGHPRPAADTAVEMVWITLSQPGSRIPEIWVAAEKLTNPGSLTSGKSLTTWLRILLEPKFLPR